MQTELEEALALFYNDIRDSTFQALRRNTDYGTIVLSEVDDYVMNHYF